MIKIELSLEDAQSLLRVLDHVIVKAENTGSSNYGIDELCRHDSSQRWRHIQKIITAQVQTTAKQA